MAVGAKPVNRTIQYDGLYRLKQIDYAHGLDEQIVAFDAEAGAGDRRPVAEVRGPGRVVQQGFQYDLQGNRTSATDNESMRYDRSLGVITNGRTGPGGVFEGPNQIVNADGIHAEYDAAGNMIELTVARSTCWPAIPGPARTGSSTTGMKSVSSLAHDAGTSPPARCRASTRTRRRHGS